MPRDEEKAGDREERQVIITRGEERSEAQGRKTCDYAPVAKNEARHREEKYAIMSRIGERSGTKIKITVIEIEKGK